VPEARVPSIPPIFVDTNVFLRFLTNDVPGQADMAEELLREAAEGGVRLVINTMAVAELVWVLESHYRLDRSAVQERALAVVHAEGLDLPESDIVTEALVDYVEQGVDFVDAFNAAWMRRNGVEQVATFDARHFDRLAGVRVRPPGCNGRG
jgi:predicted nucleic acid-binding protein